MSLPQFAAFPPRQLRTELLPPEWEACLDSWIFLARAHLLLPQKLFSLKLNKDSSITDFLLSYLRQNTIAEDLTGSDAQKTGALRSNVFLLVHRALTDGDPTPLPLLEASFLEDLSIMYGRNASLRELLTRTWTSRNLDSLSTSFRKRKSALVRIIEDGNRSTDLEDSLYRTASLLKVFYQYGQFLMEGSDFLDSLATCYEHKSPGLQKKLLVTTYLCLASLLEPDNPRMSILIDHVYTLKNASGYDNLLKALCSSTPFLQKLRSKLSGTEAARAKPLLQQLSAFEMTASGKPRNLIKRKINKGKSRAREEYGHDALDNVHVHRISQITQIQDLFPDLGSLFIIKLLDEYNDDIEQVTAHLLDNSLPDHLRQADRTENISSMPDEKSSALASGSVPGSKPPLAPEPDDTGPRSRRTVFDGDAFSNLTISPSQLHYGRAANTTQTADSMLSAPSSTANKAAILAALATFDADDDERDDTYDAEDVGGTVDSAQPGTSDDVIDAEGSKQNQHEETLFKAWKTSPGLFGRDSTTRRSQARLALKGEIGMTDEAIEGWAIMLQRDPRNLKRLESKFGMVEVGQQRGLGRSAWTNTPAGSGTGTEEEGDTDGDGGTHPLGERGGARGGIGRGRGGRGGNVAGPADDRATQVARQRKDANKGSRANHNRRNQRARKMARGGFPG